MLIERNFLNGNKIHNYFSFNFVSTPLSEIKQMEKFSVKIKIEIILFSIALTIN